MAKKHLLIPKSLVDKLPILRKFSWFVEAAVVKSLARLLRQLPTARAYGLGNRLFRWLKPVLPFTEKIRRNLQIAFPGKNRKAIERLTRAICGNLGRAAVDLVLVPRIWQERQRRIEFVAQEGMDFTLYRQRPVVLVSGHIGAWQIGAFIAAHYGLRVTAVYAPEVNPYLKDFILRLREALPVNFISRDGCMRHLTRELKQGNAVGLIVDSRYDGGERVDYFGKPIEVNTAAARLALRHQCDLVPVSTERLDNQKFRVTAHRPIRPTDPEAPAAEQARQMTAAMFRHFESWIRQDPTQWMCFSRMWPKEVFEQ